MRLKATISPSVALATISPTAEVSNPPSNAKISLTEVSQTLRDEPGHRLPNGDGTYLMAASEFVYVEIVTWAIRQAENAAPKHAVNEFRLR
jgi:hypothetical protein